MNSIIEAQQDFTKQFGPLTIGHMCKPVLILPNWSNEKVEMDEFIRTHKGPAPVKVNLAGIRQTLNQTEYYFV